MTAEDRLRSVRLEADAGPLRTAVLAATARARREGRLWRWTWIAAAGVLAIAIPVNLWVDQFGSVLAAPAGPLRAGSWPPEVKDALKSRLHVARSRQTFPRTIEDIR